MNIIVDAKGFALLKSLFSRECAPTHEIQPNAQKGAYRSFWLVPELCRQPHHPPKWLLKFREDFDGPAFLHIVETTTAAGMPVTTIMAYPSRKGYTFTVPLLALTAATHHTNGSSNTVTATGHTFCLETGGTDHGKPLYLWFGGGMFSVTVVRRSFRGGADADDALFGRVQDYNGMLLEVPSYRGQIIMAEQRAAA